VITNPGDAPVGPLDVVGELLGERREARVSSGVSAPGSAAVVLSFDVHPARAGLHPLLLLLEHPVEGRPDAAGNPPVESQRAFVTLALGAHPDPAVTLVPGRGRLDTRGGIPVTLKSADGSVHRVRLRALPDPGVRFDGPDVEVDVPEKGAVSATLPLVRAGAPPGSRHGLLVVADVLDGALARTSVAVATVDVAPDSSLVRLLRWPLVGLGVLLLALAAAAESRARKARGAEQGSGRQC